MTHGITNLLARYCERMDAGDFDGVGRLFDGGRICDENGTVLAAGSDEVAAFYRSTVRLHDGSPRTKHLVLNHVVDISGDGATTAAVRSSYLVLQGLDGSLWPMICGRYEDLVSRDEGSDPDGWRFRERRFFVDLAGDLSRHLAFDL